MRTLPLARARGFALMALAVVIGLELFNGAACYHHSLKNQLTSLGFVTVGFLPGLLALFSRNPLRTVGAALLFAPWLPVAFYTDCVRPYQGGGASMIYIAVVMYGLPCSLVGALLTGPMLKRWGITVGDS